MNYMDKMMLIKQYNEWVLNIRTETGIRSRRDFETFIDFLCERGLLHKQLTAEELNATAQKTADIINAAEAKMEAERKGKRNE